MCGPRVLLAIDSFKGSAASSEAERWVAEGVAGACAGAQVEAVPLADGGEGTVDALHASCGGELRQSQVHDPFGNEISARYLFCGGARPWAAVEMAEAASIGFSDCSEGAALAASTYGVGEQLLRVISDGAQTVYVGLGGSATNDGGAGMLQALGARFVFEGGCAANATASLASLEHLVSIDIAPALRAVEGIELCILSDVVNPLVGPQGALAVFGAQKGVPVEDAEKLRRYDGWMRSYGALLDAGSKASASVLKASGAGSAGGLGAAFLALGAQMRSGAETVLQLAGFDEMLAHTDLVITGEGHMDAQTAEGKAPVAVARHAKQAGKPCYAIVGGCDADLAAVQQQGISRVFAILGPNDPKPSSFSKAQTSCDLQRLGAQAIQAFSTALW